MNEIIMDNRIYNYIVHNSDINKDENKVIEFGIEMIKMLIVAAIVTILIALIMKMLPEAVFFLFTFIPLRQSAGGYHTRHRITCAIMSVFIYIFVLIIIKNFEFNALMQIFLCFIDSLVILYFAPVENANNELDDKDKQIYRMRTRNILILELLAFTILFIGNQQSWSGIITMSVTVAAILLSIGKLQNIIINIR